MLHRKPLITIITVVYNGEIHIEQTIRSVIAQTYENIEYIVIDGDSDDGTLEIIECYIDYIANFISEPDSGIADAMNKGLGCATGDYVLFLHSDDYLCESDSIARAVCNIANDKYDICAFDLIRDDEGRQHNESPRGWNAWVNLKTPLLHQGTLCKRALFDRIGTFDTEFKITMDYEFFLRAYRAGVSVGFIKQPLSVMRTTGISSRMDWESLSKRFGEERKAHFKHCTGTLQYTMYVVYWAFYPLYRKVKAMLI